MKINILDSKVFNRISAGEVVEKPASVVKEMVENSIDAGADSISIEIVEGGIKKIVISDNGCGIEKADIRSAFLPHATSKIKNVEDLDNIATLGFRGEALASIASVCHVFLSSKTIDNEVGYCINVDGGNFGEIKEIPRNKGTTLEVCDLFYNTPVRAKFLRKAKSEEGEVTHLVEKFMLAHSEISFSYIVDGKQVYNTNSSDLTDIIYTIYGRDVYDNLIKVDYTENDISLKGYIVSPKISKVNRTYQTLFVNERYVENYLVSSAIQSVYESFLMKGKFPIYILDIIVPTDCVDVNVHPTKKEVKFENSNMIFGFIRRAIESCLTKADHIATLNLFINEEKENNEFDKINSIKIAKLDTIPSEEGCSYVPKVDNEELFNMPIVKDIEVKEISSKKVPDFSNISLDKDISKRPGFFFDQTQEKYTYEDYKKNQMSREKIFKESLKDQIKIIGSLFNTYIILELDDNVYLVDQHAAHERQLYDKLVARVEREKIMKQPLLIPYTFKVNDKEKDLIEKAMNSFEELGFEISQSENVFEINAVPSVLGAINLKNFIEDVLSEDQIWNKRSSEIIKDKLAQNACKHAIKGGDSISLEELSDLVDLMKKGLLLCPHGRPIMLEITRKDLEKLFKRIV